MASGQPLVSIPTNHSTLGPAVSLYADRRQSLLSILLYLAFLGIGGVGLLIGFGDLRNNGSVAAAFGVPGPALGVAEISAAIVVAGWSLRALALAIERVRRPLTLVVGRDGFEYLHGHGPVGWDEVETVGTPAYRNPKDLTVQLTDPAEYAARHHLSAFDRMLLRADHHDLTIAYPMVMPARQVRDLMRGKLDEYRQAHTAPAAHRSPISTPARPKRRRQTVKK